MAQRRKNSIEIMIFNYFFPAQNVMKKKDKEILELSDAISVD